MPRIRLTMTPTEFIPGGYCYLPGVFQYSAGVAALPGFCIERVTFHKPASLLDGFRQAEEIIRAAGRPLTAFCSCELRSPAPFSETAFRDFNESYVFAFGPEAVVGAWRGGSAFPIAQTQNFLPSG